MAGVEPATSCSQSTRSARLSYIPTFKIWCGEGKSNTQPEATGLQPAEFTALLNPSKYFGAPSRIRTGDDAIESRVALAASSWVH